MKNRMIHLFAFFVLILFVISACEQVVGRNLNKANVDKVDKINLNENIKNNNLLKDVNIITSIKNKDISQNWIVPDDNHIRRDEPNEIEYQDGWPVIIEGSTWMDGGIRYNMWIGALSPIMEDLENDGSKELIFFAQERFSDKLYILESNGEIRANVSMGCGGLYIGFPSILNLYGNSDKEIIVLCNTRENTLKFLVFNKNGNLIRERNLGEYSLSDNIYGPFVIKDINGDGNPEIILGGWKYRDNPGIYLLVFDSNGNILEGFPVQLENVQFSETNTPSVGNLDNDNNLEIVTIFHRNNDRNLSKINAYKSNGDLLWSQRTESIIYSDPVIGDVNNDGYNEVIFTSPSGVHILNRFGEYILNLRLGNNMKFSHSNIALADLDNDNTLEIVFGYGLNIYAIHHNGDEIFSYQTNWLTHHPPIIGDINRDGLLDIIFNSDNDIYALNSEGELLNGFPIEIDTIAYSSPSIGNIDNDEDVELVTSSTWLDPDIYKGIIHVFDIEGRDSPPKISWPMYQHDPQHTGAYPLRQRIAGGTPARRLER